MKALSVKQPFAAYIADGHKTIEYRSWRTDYRGPLLICASARPNDLVAECDDGASRLIPAGCTCCVVDLAAITGVPGGYEWQLANPRPVVPVTVVGKLRLFEVNKDIIKFLPSHMDWLDSTP